MAYGEVMQATSALTAGGLATGVGLIVGGAALVTGGVALALRFYFRQGRGIK